MRIKTAAGQSLATTGVVEGAKVRTREGKKLGDVSTIVIDLESGRIAYFVLALHGGLFGDGGKYTPVPWGALSVDAEGEGFIANLDRKVLDEAPAYDRDQLNSDVYGWDEQVRRYFSTAH